MIVWSRLTRDSFRKVPASPVRISFDFEEASSPDEGTIEKSSRYAQAIAAGNPLMIGSCRVFEASKIADWLGSPVPARPAKGTESGAARRLRCIRLGSETLLETSFGSDGRLACISYVDGETISYEWADSGRVFWARSGSGHQTEIEVNPSDLPRSIVYDGVWRFQYDYDSDGNITSIIYPDQLRIGRQFSGPSRLASVVCGPWGVSFDATLSRDKAYYTLRHSERALEFRLQDRHSEIDLRWTEDPQHTLPVVHGLGMWRVDAQNRLTEMITPWGERFRVMGFGSGGPEAVWSQSGLQRFDYNATGGFAATTHPDASRSVLRVLECGCRALLVNPRGVTLLELDAAGRLQNARRDDGSYTMIGYSRSGEVRRVATFTETISLFMNARGLLSAIHSDCGYICKFAYSSAGELTTIVIERSRGTTVEDIRRLLHFFWQRMGLRAIHALVTG